MEECLQTLAAEQECPLDEVLVQQVRLQLVVEKVTQASWHEGWTVHGACAEVPPAFYIKALQSQLQDIKRGFSAESMRNGKLVFPFLPHLHHSCHDTCSARRAPRRAPVAFWHELLWCASSLLTTSFVISILCHSNNSVEAVLEYFYHAELTVNEIALSNAPIISNSTDFHRLECLYGCLNSIKSWFDVFFAIPLASYIGLSFPTFSHLAHCMITLLKLSTLEDPAWDRDLVQGTANLLLILDQVARNARQVNVLAGLEGDIERGELFTNFAKAADSLRAAWGPIIERPVASAPGAGQSGAGANFEALPSGFPDDPWLTDMLGSWEYLNPS